MTIKYSERLAEARIKPSVGSKGDSYDTAPAETINGLYKDDLITPALLGKHVRPSNWPRWNGCPGSITTACWNRSAAAGASNLQPNIQLRQAEIIPFAYEGMNEITFGTNITWAS